MGARAWIDESIHVDARSGGIYVLAAAISHAHLNLDEIGHQLRRLVPRRQVRLHWHTEGQGARLRIVKMIAPGPRFLTRSRNFAWSMWWWRSLFGQYRTANTRSGAGLSAVKTSNSSSAHPRRWQYRTATAWASGTATEVTIEVVGVGGDRVEVLALVAEPGPLVAMKLQAVMNRSVAKQGTDLLDIVRLVIRRTHGRCRRGTCA